MKKIQLLGLLFTAMTAYAQSTTENYVQSKTCLSGDCTKKAESITYFDGLGRPKQIVSVKSTTTGKDLVTPITYDDFGRQVKDILPVPANTLNSAIHTGIVNENTANSYYGAANAYTEKEIENSPLDRVLQVAHPGDPWKKAGGHTQKFTYEVNQGSEVKKFITSTTTGTVGADNKTISSVSLTPGSLFYNAGTLYKNTVTDEDGNPVTEFQNGRGETVLVRRTDGSQNIDTYYVYNEYGQKAFVIPALAVKKIEQNNNVVTTDIVDTYCYQYRYDGQGRQVEKRLPGRDDWESVVYDASDRPVLTQDVNLKNKGQWLMTKYDAFGRVAYTGLMSGGDRASMQNQIGTQVISESPTANGFAKDGVVLYYTNNFLPGFTTLLTVNYYDSYPRDTKEFPPAKILNQYVINEDKALNGGISTQGLPTASYVKNIEDDNWTKTYFYYNTKGGKVGEKSWNHLGGYTKKEFKLDFSSAVDESYTYHKKGASDAEVLIKERFVYDDQKRLLKHYHKVNNQSEELLVENTYNDLGQLVNKKTGNTTGVPLQSIDQAYNIRGWLTKVNDPSNLNGKLFAYEIKYHNPIYSTVSTGKYNGNIAEIDWKAADDGTFRRYNYKYDALDRLKNGIYSEPDATVPQNNYYNETLTYDVNGNILNLLRNNYVQNVGVQLMDNLNYIYKGNRLTNVNDSSGNYSGYLPTSGNLIPYDGNGNMINNYDKGILQIDYNHLNLPSYIKFDNEYLTHDEQYTYNVNTKYLYNSEGVKLRKTYTYGGLGQLEAIIKTDYLDGFQYTDDVLSFVSTSEGYYDFVQNKYIYNYTDHQGNIRLAYYKDASGNLKIDRTTHYYPFGLEFGGDLNLNGTISPNYKYSTHGKEKQQETGWSDFGTRMYMSDIGRWGVPDTLSEKFAGVSAYNYVLNNPLRYVDPDGNAPVDWIRQTVNGKSIWTYNANIKTTSQATAAGYRNVSGVYSSATISSNGMLGMGGYSYNLNAGGSVTNASGSSINNTFVTGAGTTINGPQGTFMSEAKMDFWENWANNDNLFAKIGYNMVNDAYTFTQVFDGGLMERAEWENPLGGNYGNLDGTPNYHQAEGFANTLSTIYSTVRGLKVVKEFATEGLQVASKMNAAQFSSAFKGTAISRAAPATRGLLNRSLNRGIGYVNGQVESGMKAPTVVKSTGNMFKSKDEK
jgi:RHS repeat-associated protein